MPQSQVNASHSSIPERSVYSVSKLTQEIKQLLEERYPLIWISGEISNLSIPISGHAYFTLKDDRSQIAAVMFRGQNQRLKFDLENGMAVVGLGRVGLYPPRGTYQVIFEYLEPKGIGGLQIGFEQLKKKLENEGLFHQRHKLPIPFLSRRICIITSPSGAAVRDILNILHRRWPGLEVQIIPAQVQGDRASEELAQAVELAHHMKWADLIILARGGGSAEDLASFNDEMLARAIFKSSIPIISAVGHETDFTIADFVADHRAPTPSAAAELAVPVRSEWMAKFFDLKRRSQDAVEKTFSQQKKQIELMTDRLVHPRRRIQDWQLRIDDINNRLSTAMHYDMESRINRQLMVFERLNSQHPGNRVELFKSRLDFLTADLGKNITSFFEEKRSRIQQLKATLNAVSPQAVLDRGYGIVRTLPPKQRVVTKADRVQRGQPLEIMLSEGRLEVTVESTAVTEVND